VIQSKLVVCPAAGTPLRSDPNAVNSTASPARGPETSVGREEAAVPQLARSIGRWSLTALIINSIIGSGIFGIPGVLMASTGRASPIVMALAGLMMGVIVFCYAEVGSQFSEPGGVYVYTRAAFGRFSGLQIGWFWFLSALGGAGTNANLFIDHLAGFVPWASQGWPRALLLAALLLIPATINYAGTRKGAWLSVGLTLAKMAPLLLLALFGLIRFGHAPQMVTLNQLTAPGWSGWLSGLLVLLFTYSGFEDTMNTAGEVRDTRRNIPLGLITGLGVCIVVYTLIQFVVVATLPPGHTERPLAAVAEVLFGRGGAWFVELAAMVSTYGWLSGFMLNIPRYLFAISAHREFPAFFGRLHPRFRTPHISIFVSAGLAWLLAVTGSYHWCLVLTAGASIIYFATVCAALMRLRHLQPDAARFRLPCGPLFSLLGTVISLVLLSQLHLREVLFMIITAVVAALNWWWVVKIQNQGVQNPESIAQGRL